MTRHPDEEAPVSPGRPSDADTPDPRLAERLRALPREAAPPAGTWPRVLAAERARRRSRRTIAGLAAALVVLLGGVSIWAPRNAASPVVDQRAVQSDAVPPDAAPHGAVASDAARPDAGQRVALQLASNLLPEESQDPRLHAAVQELEAWHIAAADPRRSGGWPATAQQAVLEAVHVTEAELAQLRVAIGAVDNDPARRRQLLDQLATLRARQLEQLQRARALLDQL
jgi:hypothetical protein